MNSNWFKEVSAIFKKELVVEVRDKTGISTAAVFGLATVVTITLSLYRHAPAVEANLRDVCASLEWIILIFASLLTLPRTFLGEEERRTGDLLRMTARPYSVFWGKTLFNLLQMWLLCLIITPLFLALAGLWVFQIGMFVGCLIFGSAAIVGAVSVCGAIAAQASNRAALAATISIPLILIPLQWGVTGLMESFKRDPSNHGIVAVFGLFAYAILSIGNGPWIYAAIWKS